MEPNAKKSINSQLDYDCIFHIFSQKTLHPMKLKALSTILAAIQGKQTPESNSKINTKIDEFEETPYQRELRFDAVDHPAEYSWLQCRDYPDWKDGDGETCEKLAYLVPKGFFDDPYDDEHYTDEYDFCSLYGGYYDSGNTDGVRILNVLIYLFLCIL